MNHKKAGTSKLISLSPLTTDQALSDLLKVKPAREKRVMKGKPKRTIRKK